ncbi:MAG: hypothetical protein WC856_21485 [Methylococcaceae bacterium]|jgi:hypothetical protein
MTYVLMVLAILLEASQTARAQEFERDLEYLVVPDKYYIAERCSEPQNTLKWVRDDKELLRTVDIKAAERVAMEISFLCEKEAKGEISHDSWLELFQELSGTLESLTDPCGRTVMCEKIFLPPPKPLPNNFDAYTIFLFPSAEWSQSERNSDLQTIRRTFASFGDSIGHIKAAIWFTKDRHSNLPDIERSKYYCDLLKLNYNDGPYIVTSRKRPDGILSKDDFIIIKLNGIVPNRINYVLNILEQDLRTDAKLRKRSLIYEEIKQRLLSIADRNPEIVKELTKGAISVVTKQ